MPNHENFSGSARALRTLFFTLIVTFIGVCVVFFAIDVVYPGVLVGPSVKATLNVLTTGLFTAIFTKLLFTLGYFRDALSDLLHDDAWINKRSDLPKLWKRLTTKLFLPEMIENTHHKDHVFDAIDRAMSRIIKSEQSTVEFYGEAVKRTITISWENDSKINVVIEDSMEFDVIPYDREKGCRLVTRFTPTSGLDKSEWKTSLVRLSVDGAPANSAMSTTDADDRLTTELRSGKERYKVKRLMKFVQPLDRDPIFACEMESVVLGMDVTVNVVSEGLQAVFDEPGSRNLFKDSDSGRLICRIASPDVALLPRQGFYVIMTRG